MGIHQEHLCLVQEWLSHGQFIDDGVQLEMSYVEAGKEVFPES
jgi:hypothetical protein